VIDRFDAGDKPPRRLPPGKWKLTRHRLPQGHGGRALHWSAEEEHRTETWGRGRRASHWGAGDRSPGLGMVCSPALLGIANRPCWGRKN